jgi:hypothetical protein
MGGFYRLSESKPWELQALIGYKAGWVLPVYGGGYHDYSDSDSTFPDYHFDSGLGATIEGGWSWIGVQCTYIEYGSLDASNCGVRFTWRFRKFGPLP